MRKIREILRLKEEAGLPNRAIAWACKISKSTGGEYLRWTTAANLHWLLKAKVREEMYAELNRRRAENTTVASAGDRPSTMVRPNLEQGLIE